MIVTTTVPPSGRRRRAARRGRPGSASAAPGRSPTAATARGVASERGHHVAPGCARATPCSSASSSRSASVCRRRARTAPRAGAAVRAAAASPRRAPVEHASTSSRSAAGSTPTPAAASRRSTSCVREQLVEQRPDGVERRPGPAGATRRCRRRAGATQRRGVVAVVGQLLDALGGDRGEHRVARVAQPVEQRQPPGREHQQPDDRYAKSPFGASTSRDVAELARRRGRRPARPRSRPGAVDRSPARGAAAAGPGRAGRARCWPARSPPPARARACTTPGAGASMTSASSPSIRQYAARSARVDAVGHGRVDAGERVVEAGAERPVVASSCSLGRAPS